MPCRPRFDRDASRPDGDVPPSRVEQRGADERHERQCDKGAERGRDRRQLKEVKTDVSPEKRFRLTDRHTMQEHERGHPLGRQDQCGDDGDERRTSEQ
jgi:hypothetical protein